MRNLFVVADVSGSMYAGGKLFVVQTVLQTLNTAKTIVESEKISIEKINWDGTEKGFEELTPKLSGKCSIILTDGYAILDNCGKSRIAKKFFDENRNSLSVILCGGDSINISKLKDFSKVRTVTADNALLAFETLLVSENMIDDKKNSENAGGD